jgi:hypothetical protein
MPRRCGTCYTQIENSDEVCPRCGASVDPPDYSTLFFVGVVSIIVVLAMLIGALVAKLFWGH